MLRWDKLFNEITGSADVCAAGAVAATSAAALAATTVETAAEAIKDLIRVPRKS